MKILLSIILIFIGISPLFAQNNNSKEVLIIGTMHTVSKLQKNSYKPLYKKALSYKPNRIYVETAMPNDTISWHYLKNGYSKFLRDFSQLHDSLKINYEFNPSTFTQILDKDLNQLSSNDIDILLESFAYLRDAPNYKFYKVIKLYGLNFKKNFRNEDQELTAKLAITLNHKKVYATDDQKTNAEFHTNWHKCEEKTANTKYDKKARKISNKITRRMIIPSLFGRYGIATNKLVNLEDLNTLSGMLYSKGANTNCDLAIDFFKQRNERIAFNLGTQIENSNLMKNVLIIGASHVIGVRDALKKQFPEITVLTLNNLK